MTRDGKSVFFVSLASDLTKDPDMRAANLYVADAATRKIKLVSVGMNGQPANDSIEAYDFSADGRKVLFETRADNLVPNDTNNAVDVFLRDLDSNQTILISLGTNGAPAGGFDASLSADGNRIAFASKSNEVVANDPSLNDDIFVRDLAAGTTEIASLPAEGISSGPRSRTPAISADGRFVVFETRTESGVFAQLIRDLDLGVTVTPTFAYAGRSTGWLLSGDGQSVLFGIAKTNSAQTNLLIRYEFVPGVLETVAAGTTYAMIPLAVSDDARLVAIEGQLSGPEWVRSGEAPRKILNPDTGFNFAPLNNLVPAMSGDGKFVTFVGTFTNGMRTLVYDLEQNSFARLSSENDGGVIAISSDPAINYDGSLVAFGAEVDAVGVSSNRTLNIFLWSRATGQSELLTQADAPLVQWTARAGSLLPKGGVSEDGNRILYRDGATRAIVRGGRTNQVGKATVLDRRTGERQVVSVDRNGQANLVYGEIMSANGRAVAFTCNSTNLVDMSQEAPSSLSFFYGLFYRDLETLQTRLVTRTNRPSAFGDPLGNLSFSRDGRFLAFTSYYYMTQAGTPNVCVYDAQTDQTTLISKRLDGRGLTGFGVTSSAISPDGKWIVYQTRSGQPVNETEGFRTYRVDRETGETRVISLPFGTGPIEDWPIRQYWPIRFTRNSAAVYYVAGENGRYEYADLLGHFNRFIATNIVELELSDDTQWAVLTRREGPENRKQVYLRNVATKAEQLISTNAITGGKGNDHSLGGQFSKDGRYIVFDSRASNLVTNDLNQSHDIFVYDRISNLTRMLTRKPDGNAPNGASQRGILTSDGSTVIFKSHATDLAPNDFNDAPDLFAISLLPPLKVTDIEKIGQIVRIWWQSNPGQIYRIQASTSLEPNSWENVGGTVTTDSNSASKEIPFNGEQSLFFRVTISN